MFDIRLKAALAVIYFSPHRMKNITNSLFSNKKTKLKHLIKNSKLCMKFDSHSLCYEIEIKLLFVTESDLPSVPGIPLFP